MKNIALLLLLSLLAMTVQSQNIITSTVGDYPLATFEEVDLVKEANAIDASFRQANPALDDGVTFTLSPLDVDELLFRRTGRIRLPFLFPDGQTRNLLLIPARSQSPSFEVYDQDRRSYTPTEQDAHHYWGMVEGEARSMVSISVFHEQMIGMIMSETGAYNIAALKDDPEGRHLLYRQEDLNAALDFECGVDEPIDFEVDHQAVTNRSSTNPGNCVLMYVEVDNDITVDKGGVANTTDYITGLFNQISLMYFNEAINLNIHQLVVWDQTDPYTGPSTSNYLSQFRTATGLDFNGDLAHLVGYQGGGGIASLDVLCSTFYSKHGYSGINPNYNDIPVYSWSVEVVTHEIGHNLGSRHTHDCVWNGNNTAIDRCGIEAGYGTNQPCNQNAGLPVDGTVMSYCHLVGVGIDLALGFGPQPGDLIRDRVYNAACLSPCEPSPEVCNDGFDNDFDGLTDCEDPDCDEYVACLPCEQSVFNFSLTFDNRPTETSWELTDQAGDVVESGTAYANNLIGQTITEEFCLDEACYTLTIFDSGGDGLCCNYGEGGYNLTDVDGMVIANGGIFTSETSIDICDGVVQENCYDGIDNDLDGLVDCNDPDCTENADCLACLENVLNFIITFDDRPEETSWEILDGDGMVVHSGAGSTDIPDGATLQYDYCLSDGCYDFRIMDSGNDGICCIFGLGTYVLQGSTGAVYAAGGEFASEELTSFCTEVSVCPQGTTFTVTTTQDSVAGSLRQAINCANALAELDTIVFDLAIDDTLFINGGLPSIVDDNILIDGAGERVIVYDDVQPLFTVASNFNTIQGFTIFHARPGFGRGVLLEETSTNFSIRNNRIEDFRELIDIRGRSGLVRNNTLFGYNGQRMITVLASASQILIDSNTISSPEQATGVYVTTDDVEIRGNEMFNLRNGVQTSRANRILIEGNTMYDNWWGANIDGILGDGQSHRITQNSFYCNRFNGGIQLRNGANADKAPPVLTEANENELSGTAAPGDLIEVFLTHDGSCTFNVLCQGKTYLNTTFADPDGNWILDGLNLTGDEVLTATATDSDNNTSPFAECLTFVPSCPEVVLSLEVNRSVLCPGDGVELSLSGDIAWGGSFSWILEVNGEPQTVTDFTLADILVLYPELATEYSLVSAVNTFDCDLELGNTSVMVDVVNEEDLMSAQTIEICSGESITIDGEEVEEPGMYTATYASVNGCDSLVQIELIVFESQQTEEELSICEGEEIELFGEVVTAAGLYQATFDGQNGCDSTHSITLSVFSPVSTDEALQICAGESVELFGEEVSTSGTYTGNFTSVNDCDSTHTVVLTVVDQIETSEALTLCSGNSVVLFGEEVSEAGTYEGTFLSAAGCDSIHQVTVTLIDVVNTSDMAQICTGESIELFGEVVSEAGEYSETFESSLGCDSTHTITLVVAEPFFTDETIQACSGQSVTVFGETYTDDASATATFTASNGCDSTHTVAIVFAELIETSEMLSICEGESILIFGEETSDAGVYTESFVSAAGCDSIHEVNLMVFEHVAVEELIDICEGESVEIFGNLENTSGTYEETFLTINGCDSTHTVVLTVTDQIETSETLSLCSGSSVMLFGEEVSEAGTYEGTFLSAAGCDSIHQVTVTLIDVVNTSDMAQICTGESIELFGEVVSEAGEYSETFESSLGCDSTHTITLVVAEPLFTDETIQACSGQSVMVFGETYTDDASAAATFAASNGCDSTHTVQIVFAELIETSEMLSICEGESIIIFGEEISDAGVYTESFVSTAGCDSVHEVSLSILEHIVIEDFIDICEGESVEIFGNLENTSGTYESTFTASNGCDSTQVYYLDVLEPTSSEEERYVCEGESAVIFGEAQNEPGLYTETFTAANGCDSVANVELSFYDLPTIEALTTPSCAGEPNGTIALASDQVTADYQWAHTPENTSMLDGLTPDEYVVTVTDDNACESVWEFLVEELPFPEYEVEISEVSCAANTDGLIEIISNDPGLEISFAGGPYMSTTVFGGLSPDTYIVNIRTAEGCESTEEITLEASESVELMAAEVEQPTCAGQEDGSIHLEVAGGNMGHTFMWNTGQAGAQLNNLDVGTYIVTITNANGCSLESTIELPGEAPIATNLQVLLGCGDGEIIAISQPSAGQPPYEVSWSNDQSGNVASNLTAGMYDVVLTDANGCTITESFEVPFIPPFEVDYVAVDPACADDNDGQINLLISGGILPYGISWSNGSDSPVLEGLSTGVYTYNVSSASCGLSASVQIQAPANLGAIVNFSVDAQQNVEATALASGGTPPYSFLWSNGSTNNPLNGLQEGQVIELTVRDANGCTFTESYTVMLTNTLSPEAATLRIFPNPSSDRLFIEHNNANSWSYDLELYDINGAALLQMPAVQTISQELSLSTFPPGVYLLVLSNDSFRRVERIVVVR
ncbi:M12 family metallo-peptidase [Lewinella cohaerens]|uniref:M12 family metallo-peptidase n=1 Tax=Lewinella cohaerens TaxID=70995 RepID=UPI00037226C2|nr:M12 family metallo-peptidase [Lewinella cohaerens]